MLETQNETLKSGEPKKPSALSPKPSAFTLVELLVVISIIGILAALITGAAINAMIKAKQAAITMELQQIGAAMEDLKNELGAYPPNGMNNDVIVLAENDFVRMFKKSFPRSQEPLQLINALASRTTGSFPGGSYNVTRPQKNDGSSEGGGLTGAEALCFWLGGFSSDVSYPISGPGGPSFQVNNSLPGLGEVLEDRQLRYEFDLGRLSPRTTDNAFDDTNARYITYNDPRISPAGTGPLRRINLWRYTPSGSTEPIAYFDTSRHTPEEYDLPLSGIAGGDIYALKKFREGVTSVTATVNADVRFLADKKFQILHCGADDIWGDQFIGFHLDVATNGNSAYQSQYLTTVPEGPFIGDIADTVGNFLTGTLEDEQE